MTRIVIKGKPVSQKNGKRILQRRDGRPFIASSTGALSWKAAAVAQIKDQYRGNPLEGALRLDAIVYQGERQRIDLDNALAGVFDALQAGGVVRNDYQIEELSAMRARDNDNPRVVVVIDLVGNE